MWVQLPQKEVDLFTYDYMDRDFSILNGRYVLKFTKQNGFINDLHVWMRRHSLFQFEDFLKAHHVHALEDLDDFDMSKLDSL